MWARIPRSVLQTAGPSLRHYSLATCDLQLDGNGNWEGRTEWHNLVAFDGTAGVVRDYVRQSSQLLIEGLQCLVSLKLNPGDVNPEFLERRNGRRSRPGIGN
jgi:hypothetical protein